MQKLNLKHAHKILVLSELDLDNENGNIILIRNFLELYNLEDKILFELA